MGPPFCNPLANDDHIDRLFPKRQSLALDIYSIGATFAYEVLPNLSVGMSVLRYNFTMDASSKVFSARGGDKFADANFAEPANLELTSTQAGNDHAWAANVGLSGFPNAETLNLTMSYVDVGLIGHRVQTRKGPV